MTSWVPGGEEEKGRWAKDGGGGGEKVMEISDRWCKVLRGDERRGGQVKMLSHSIWRAGMTGERPAAEKVETHDRDGRNDQLSTMGPVEREGSAGKWETKGWMQEGSRTGRNDQWENPWVNRWRRPATGLAGMTSGVVEGESWVGKSVAEVTGEGSQMACGCIAVRWKADGRVKVTKRGPSRDRGPEWPNLSSLGIEEGEEIRVSYGPLGSFPSAKNRRNATS